MLNTRIGRLGLVLGALLGLSLVTTQSQAQVIGFKLGPTFSTLQFNEGESDENRLTSFGGGGFIRFGLGGISLQPEILAVTKGSDIDGLGNDDVQLQLNYIEVPLLARLSLGSSTSFTPYVMAGPSFGFEIGCDVELEFGEDESSSECGDDDIADRKTLDIGLTGVLGIEFRMGPGALLVEGRYAHGLTDLSGDDGALTMEVKNRSFGLMAGYAIPLGATGITSSRRQLTRRTDRVTESTERRGPSLRSVRSGQRSNCFLTNGLLNSDLASLCRSVKPKKETLRCPDVCVYAGRVCSLRSLFSSSA